MRIDYQMLALYERSSEYDENKQRLPLCIGIKLPKRHLQEASVATLPRFCHQIENAASNVYNAFGRHSDALRLRNASLRGKSKSPQADLQRANNSNHILCLLTKHTCHGQSSPVWHFGDCSRTRRGFIRTPCIDIRIDIAYILCEVLLLRIRARSYCAVKLLLTNASLAFLRIYVDTLHYHGLSWAEDR
jgi:hypothetical protein